MTPEATTEAVLADTSQSTFENTSMTSDNWGITSEWNDSGTKTHLTFYSIIGGVGMMDNGLVIAVILLSKAMREKVCNILIIHQSTVDFVSSLLLVVNSPLSFNGKPPTGLQGELYCRLWANSFPLFTAFLLSIVNLVFVTMERYAEIVYPIQYKVYFTRQRVGLAILAMWVLCPAVNFGLVGYASKLRDDGESCAIHSNYPSEAVRILDSLLVYLLAIPIPLLVMGYCYIRMLRALRRVVPALNALSVAEKKRHERRQRVRRNLIKTLLMVSVAYVMCVAWNQTYFLLLGLGVSLPYDSPFYHFTVYALFTNSIINPFIYTARYRHFQESAKVLIKKMLPCLSKPVAERDSANVTAVSTLQ